MLVGVVVNLIASVLVFGLAIVAGTQNSALFTSIREVLLTNYLVSDDTAVLLVGAGLLGNMAILLVLVVVIIAQEFWTVIVAIALLVVNGVALFALGFTPSVLTIIPLAIVGAMTLRDLRAFRGNPVTLKELRGRMRGVRGFAIITIFLGLMSFFTILLYLLQVPAGGVVVTGELGRLLFVGILFIELMLIIFIVPALTAGAITTERERKTYDLLQTTLITKSAFVIGKMESALGYIMLLLLSAIPLQSIAFLFGGVSESELILALVVLAVSAITLGAFGMFFSSVTDRTLSATVRSYTVAMMITVGVPIVAFMFFRGAYANVISNVATNLGNNPVTEAAYIYLDMIATSLNPITATIYSQQMLIDHQQLVFMRVTLASNGTTIPVLSPWVLLTVTYLTVTALLVMISIRRMERQGE
jgi:ABC-type transport system involved in multi-copper enzyme maturation permease subunit